MFIFKALGAPKIDNEAAIKEHLRTLEHEKKQWDEQILDLKKSTTSLNKLKENLQTEVSGLNSQLQHKEIEMKRLNDKLSNRTQNVSQLEEKLKKGIIITIIIIIIIIASTIQCYTCGTCRHDIYIFSVDNQVSGLFYRLHRICSPYWSISIFPSRVYIILLCCLELN